MIVIQRIKIGTKRINECECRRLELSWIKLSGLVETHPLRVYSEIDSARLSVPRSSNE